MSNHVNGTGWLAGDGTPASQVAPGVHVYSGGQTGAADGYGGVIIHK